MNNKILFTGERFVPSEASPGSEIYDCHMGRYNFASKFAGGKRVLDISCGEGYGSFILSGVALSVLGIDKDEETISLAAKNYKKDNIIFSVGSAESIKYPHNSFDLVVSFETIEHLTKSEQVSFIDGIKDCLSPEGIIVISTPDKDIYGSGHNEFHLSEFSKKEFIKFLSSRFSIQKIYGQDVRKEKANYFLYVLRRFLNALRTCAVWGKVKPFVSSRFKSYLNVKTNIYSVDVSESDNIVDPGRFSLKELSAGESAKYLVVVCKNK